jgi:ankyrin repeat protein
VIGCLSSLTLLLLNAGSDIHAIEGRGFSALELAVGNGDVQMVELLLEVGANVVNFDFSRIVYQPAVTSYQYHKNKRLVRQAMDRLVGKQSCS